MAVIRDLRSDLIARLEDIPKRRDRSNDRHLAELQAIQDEEKVLRAMLELGACLNSRCSIVSESDSSLGYEQVFSPLEYRSDAASAAACAGFRAERPCLAVYRRVGAGEPRSEGDHGQLCERARAAAV